MNRYILVIAAVGLATPSVAAPPQSPASPSANALAPILSCRAITNAQVRLACFDRSVATLADATAKRDIVVVDRTDVVKARRSLFGFTLPNLRIFGDSAANEENALGPTTGEVLEINSTVRAAREDGAGNWIITLDDGAVWHQTDGQTIARAPRAGDAVVIRRAALGSYFLRIGKQPGVKARRDS